MNFGFQGGTVRLDRIPKGWALRSPTSILENRNSQSRELTDISDNSPPESPPFRVGDITGQSLPDFLWWLGESLKVAHDHSAQ